EFDYHEVRTKRAIIENSRHFLVVVYLSIFGGNGLVNLGIILLVIGFYTDYLPRGGVLLFIK
ncbi:DeoR/GlpR family transcriptional regulator, partial [Enterobacter intestinihominis]